MIHSFHYSDAVSCRFLQINDARNESKRLLTDVFHGPQIP